MGLTEEELLEHWTGIAFLVTDYTKEEKPNIQPWNRMGNIHAWGGPLTEEIRYNEFLLNKKVNQIVVLVDLVDC